MSAKRTMWIVFTTFQCTTKDCKKGFYKCLKVLSFTSNILCCAVKIRQNNRDYGKIALEVSYRGKKLFNGTELTNQMLSNCAFTLTGINLLTKAPTACMQLQIVHSWTSVYQYIGAFEQLMEYDQHFMRQLGNDTQIIGAFKQYDAKNFMQETKVFIRTTADKLILHI